MRLTKIESNFMNLISNYIYLFHVETSSSWAWELSLSVRGEENPSFTLLTLIFWSQWEHLSPLSWSHASLQTRWSREVSEHLHLIFNIANPCLTHSSVTNALHCIQVASSLWTIVDALSTGKGKSGTVAPPANFHKEQIIFINLFIWW